MAKATYTVFDGEVVSQVRNGVRRDYASTPDGSIAATLTSTPTTGATYTYWPFGNPRSTSGDANNSTPFRYKGAYGYYFEASNRHYVRARYLNTTYGRWYTIDPLWRHQMAYGYVNNNPINNFDPSGMVCKVIRTRTISSHFRCKRGHRWEYGPKIVKTQGKIPSGSDCLRCNAYSASENCRGTNTVKTISEYAINRHKGKLMHSLITQCSSSTTSTCDNSWSVVDLFERLIELIPGGSLITYALENIANNLNPCSTTKKFFQDSPLNIYVNNRICYQWEAYVDVQEEYHMCDCRDELICYNPINGPIVLYPDCDRTIQPEK